MMMPMHVGKGSSLLTAICTTCPEGTSSVATQWLWEKSGIHFGNRYQSDDAYNIVSESTSHLTYEAILTYLPASNSPLEMYKTVKTNNEPLIAVASVPNMNLLRLSQDVWHLAGRHESGQDVPGIFRAQRFGSISSTSELKFRPADDSAVYQPVV
jgi:hypothetical protein